MLEYTDIKDTNLIASRIALGTWAIGGWMWGGTDEKESIRTIHAALDYGINLIDTAPIYGQGRSEEIVGEALRQTGRRESILLATKVGIDWTRGRIERNSTRRRIFQELEDSLRRLQTDYSIYIRCTGRIPSPHRRSSPHSSWTVRTGEDSRDRRQ